MSVAPVEPTPTDPAVSDGPPAAAATPPTPTPPPSAPKADEPGNVWENPDAAKAEIDRLRKENGAARTNAKAQAAEDARKELAQTIGKALGLVEDEPIDPAKLTELATTSQADAKQARVELAVFRNAATAGGDPAALLDSSSFLTSLAAIDPADPAAVQAALTAAVTANPRLGAAPAGPQAPAPNPAQGAASTGAVGKTQATKAELDRMTPDQIVEARREGRLDHLLGTQTTT